MVKRQTSCVCWEFRNGCYPYSVFVGVGISDLFIRKHFVRIEDKGGRLVTSEFKRGENVYGGNTAVGVQIVGERHGYVGVMFNINPNVPVTANTLAHEASHAADWMCDHCGITYGTFETGESHAYIAGMVAGWIERVAKGEVSTDIARRVKSTT